VITRSLIFINCFLFIATWSEGLPFSQKNSSRQSFPIHLPTVSANPVMFCTGSLGDNIFTDGDFGSGSSNNLPSDANGYAPSYNYQPNPPPNDGFYTITNNTSPWGSFAASSWVNSGDNSNDPDGYMMVINASFAPGIFYENTVDDLCENTLYQFSADVLNLMQSGGIKPNIDFLIDGVVQYSTGDVPVNGSWNNYGFTFTSAPGTSSLTLAIRNNAPGGQGNDLAIDNIEFRACGPELTVQPSVAFLCDGIPVSLLATIVGSQYDTPYYQWQESTNGGITWNDMIGENDLELFLAVPVDGYQYRLLASNSSATIDNPKCRIVSNFEVIEVIPQEFIFYDTLCQGLELQVGNSIYNTTGIYTDSLTTSFGCDSTVITHLEIVPDVGISADFDLTNPNCAGSQDGEIFIANIQNGSGIYEYQWNDDPFQTQPIFEFLTAGIHQVTIRDHYGCESVFDLELFDPPVFTIDLGNDVTIRLGETYDIQPISNLPIDSYSWLETTGLECTTDCLNPTAAPVETTAYTLTATDENGCTATDNIIINVDKTRNVFIPNAFSPNGDGYNDYFTIYAGIDVTEVVTFHIFDRWGGLVFSNKNFQPNDELIGWNGFLKGKKAEGGVYVYTAEILFKDGLVERFSGDLLIKE